MNLVRGLFLFLWDLVYFLTGEGSWALRPHERTALEAAIENLPDEARAVMRTKMKGIVFVRRSHRQISRPRFYCALYVPNGTRFDAVDGAELLLDVEIKVDGERQHAHVEFFQGLLDSIQFSQPATFYAGKVVKAVQVKRGDPSLAHAAAIDRREH